jgi:hypothetical protein
MLGGDQQQEYGGRAQQRLVDWDADRCQAQQGMADGESAVQVADLATEFFVAQALRVWGERAAWL